MKRILITGGHGFIGSNFIETYKDKYDIVAPAADQADLTKYEDVDRLFSQQTYDAVLHLQGRLNDGEVSPTADLIAFKNVQYASVLYGVKKLLIAGDAADLDLSRPVENATEETLGESEPLYGYGLSRYLISVLAQKDKISTVLRFFDVYGKGGSVQSHRTLGILSHALVGKKSIALEKDKTFSTLYVEDACKILALFLENDYPRGVYNAASPTPAHLSEFAKKAKAYAKKNDRDVAVTVGQDSEYESTASVDKLLGVLGGFKFTALSTGITKTLDYYKSHKGKLRAEKD